MNILYCGDKPMQKGILLSSMSLIKNVDEPLNIYILTVDYREKGINYKPVDKAFAKYDIILGPVAPTTALTMGESLSDPIKMYLGDVYTVPVNLAGLPGISLPCGYDKDGMPIGVQMVGDAFNEKAIIQAAYAFEQTREYKQPAAVAERGL